MALTLPVVIYLQLIIFKALPEHRGLSATLFGVIRHRLRLFIIYLVLMVGYLTVRFYLIVGPAVTTTDGEPLLKRLAFVPMQVLEYLKLTVFPFGLSAEYLHSYPARFWDPLNLLAMVLVAGLIFMAWRLREKIAVLAFGIGWFFITLTPVLNIYELINPLAERYLYLPTIGVAIAAVAALAAVHPEEPCCA